MSAAATASASASTSASASASSSRRRRRRSPPSAAAPSALSRARVLQALPAHPGTKVVAVLWSPSGHYLATAAQTGVVRMFYVLRARAGRLRASPIRTFAGHSADVLAMAFSNTDFLLTASRDRTVRLWHADTHLCLRRLLHPDMVTAVAFHPTDENFVLTGACDAVARLWKPAEHKCVAQQHVGAVVTAAAFSRDGTAAFVGTFNGRVMVLDVGEAVVAAGGAPDKLDDDVKPLALRRSVDIRGTKRGKAGGVAGMGVDVARDEVVVSGSDGRVTLLAGSLDADLVGRVRVGGKKGDAGGVRLGGSVSADGRYLVFDGVGGGVRVVELEKGRRREERKKKETVVGVEEVTVMEEGAVSCAAFATKRAVEVAGVGKEAGALLIAVGGDDGVVRIVGVGE